MIGYTPRQPDGNDAEALFHRHTLAREQYDRVTQAPGVRVNRTTRGVSIVPIAQSASGIVGVNVAWFMFSAMATDYVIAFPADPLTRNATSLTPVNVALPMELRATWHGKDDLRPFGLGDAEVSYTYQSAQSQQRIASWTQGGVANTETQIISPPFLLGQYFPAMAMTVGILGPDGKDIGWQMLPGRQWMAI